MGGEERPMRGAGIEVEMKREKKKRGREEDPEVYSMAMGGHEYASCIHSGYLYSKGGMILGWNSTPNSEAGAV